MNKGLNVDIALTGEGKTDYGYKEYGSNEWKWGPIASYIKSIAAKNDIVVNLYPIAREEIKGFKLQRSMQTGVSGHGVPARKFAILMKKNGYTNGIFYCDADKDTGAYNSEHQAVKRFEKVYDEVKTGLDFEGVEAIPMIALRMVEAWIMGDKKAIEKVFDIDIPLSVFPKNPELLWGDVHNPKSDYPKHYFTRMVSSRDKKYRNYSSSMEDFCKIADFSDVDVLRKTCKISFAKFYGDFENMIL